MAKIYTTPKGTSRYSYTAKPDEAFGETKYKTDLILSEDDAKTLKETLKAIAAEAYPGQKGVKLPTFKDEEDGTFSVTFKSIYKPVVVDAKNQPLPADFQIYQGSTIRVAYSAGPYPKGTPGKGVSVKLVQIKVLEPAQGSGTGGQGAAFEDEEGFVYEAPADLVQGGAPPVTQVEELEDDPFAL